MQERDGYRSVAYYVNWAIYGRNHDPQDLPFDRLTHVLYAFANVRPESGEVYLSDTWSDLEKHYPNDSWNDPGGPNMYGCLKQLGLLKRRNRNLKTLISIGGWTYSPNFAQPASSTSGRATFARTAAQLVTNCGLDGVDIDWEYPKDAREASDFALLLRDTRAALDAAAQRLGAARFLLTVACPAGPYNIELLHIAAMDAHLDFWNLMAYDYAGPWDDRAAHQANVAPSRTHPRGTPFSTEAAVGYYVARGVAPGKIVIGAPLYGRAFVGTDGPGDTYEGVGDGTWENGVWDWKALPREGAAVRMDEKAVASWSYDAQRRTMVSFDSHEVVTRKAEWVKEQGLGGVMWWESSGDRKVGEGSAIEATVRSLRGETGQGLERRANVIDYPDSKYENLRNGFGDEGRLG